MSNIVRLHKISSGSTRAVLVNLDSITYAREATNIDDYWPEAETVIHFERDSLAVVETLQTIKGMVLRGRR